MLSRLRRFIRLAVSTPSEMFEDGFSYTSGLILAGLDAGGTMTTARLHVELTQTFTGRSDSFSRGALAALAIAKDNLAPLIADPVAGVNWSSDAEVVALAALRDAYESSRARRDTEADDQSKSL